MKTSTALRKARALIEDPRNWTQNVLRRTDKRSPAGFRCCAIGALDEVSKGRHDDGVSLLHECSRDLFKISHVASLNDGKRGVATEKRPTRRQAHARVLEVYACAIKKATAAEKAG